MGCKAHIFVCGSVCNSRDIGKRDDKTCKAADRSPPCSSAREPDTNKRSSKLAAHFLGTTMAGMHGLDDVGLHLIGLHAADGLVRGATLAGYALA